MAIGTGLAKQPRVDGISGSKPGLHRAPSLDGLRAFEVAARHLSFTRAAAELCVTQGAISQRIKVLEHELRFALFERRKTGLILTMKGRCLAEGVRTGLEQITRSIEQMADDASGPLVISVLPSFASRWLIPRLSRFAVLGSDANVQILAESGLADLRDRGVHAALRFGLGSYPGLEGTMLMRDSIVPVCSPDLLSRLGPVATATDLAHLPVLHDSSTENDGSGTDWASWFRQTGVGHVRLAAGQRFSQAGMMLDAAVGGLGIALGRVSLVGDDLAANRLVRLPLPAVPTAYAYHLLCRPEMADDRRVTRFRDWLLSELSDSPIGRG